MTYRLTWINYWDEERTSDDPRVIIRHTGDSGNLLEHEYNYYFNAESDHDARKKALAYIETTADDIEIFSVVRRKDNQIILTEENI